MNSLEDSQRIDRRIGWIMSLGGAAIIIGQAPIMLAAAADYPLWWNLGVGSLAAVVSLLALIGWLLPYSILLICWRASPLIAAGLMLSSFYGYRSTELPEILPWILSFDATLGAYLLLWLPPWAAASGTFIGATLTPMSALIFLGEMPEILLQTMPIHMSNIVFIAIFFGIRQRMLATQSAAQTAMEYQKTKKKAEVAAEQSKQVSRILHDDVLSVLTAAFRTRGMPSPQLQTEAERALALLQSPPPKIEANVEDCANAIKRLSQAVSILSPKIKIEISSADGQLPTEVTDTVIAASIEAVRNCLRHANSDSKYLLNAHANERSFQVTVQDSGPGFDPALIPATALGITNSIIGRMRELPGGSAKINSRPGGFTVVELLWLA